VPRTHQLRDGAVFPESPGRRDVETAQVPRQATRATRRVLGGRPHKLCLAGCPLNPLTAAGAGSRALSPLHPGRACPVPPSLPTALSWLWLVCASGNKSVEVQTEAERTAVNSNHSVMMFSKFKKKKKSIRNLFLWDFHGFAPLFPSPIS